MKRCHFAVCLISIACLLAPTARTQTVSCTINVPGFDAGSYDAYGESDTRREGGGAGLGALSHVRGPYHSFIAFHVPDFAGTITSASLVGNAFVSSYNGAETLEFFSVTSSVTSVRDGGLSQVAIYDDLGSGSSYGNCTLAGGYWITAVPLNENAVADIQAARGNDFVMGGALLNVTAPPNYNAFVNFPEYGADQVRLQLEISAPAQPTIHTQPPAQNALSVSNSPALFSVGACGAEPMLYRWFVNGVGQSWQSSAPFYAAGLTTNPVPVFVIVSNAFGMATSSVVEAKFPPAIFRPAFTNLTVRVGESVSLLPSAQVFAYPSEWTWEKDGVPFSNDQNYQLHLPNLQASDSGDYTLTISNSLGVATSPVVRLRVVETPPVFWEEPYDQRVPLGSIVYLGATAAAGPSASYQWYFNGTPVVSTNASLELLHISNTQTGRYYVVASNAFGKATSDVVSVTTYLDPPEFLQNPRDAIIYPGGYALLSVGLRGQPYPSVQWLHDGVPIPGASSENLQIQAASSNSAGAYVCVASNDSGMTISSPAQVSVLYVPPVLDISPTNLVSGAGYPAVFYVHVLNPPASLDAQREGMNVPAIFNGGPEYFTLQFSNVETNQSGLYRIVASNAYGMSTSAVLSLTVTSSPPSFALSPQSQTALEGTDVWLSFNAGAAPAPTFTLFHDNLPIQLVAKDNQVFVLPYTSLADAGEYFIVASNLIGRATSDVARITIQRAGPLDKWTQRNPSPQGNELFAIAFGQNKFVAVGRNGAIITSTNGTNWNVRSLRTTAELHDIAYANGQFVVVGEDGTVLTSTNGESWTRQTLPASALHGIAFGADRFVAVGQKVQNLASPAIFVSSNAVDWIEFTASFPAGSYLTSVAFGPGGFAVADGYQGNYSSTDLISWNSSTTNLFDTESVRYLNGRYLATGRGGRTATSADAEAWNWQTIATRRLFDVAYGASRYVIVGGKGNIFHSPDAALWSPASSPVTEDLEGVAFGNGLFAAVGEHGIILTSADGQNWFSQILGSANDLDGLAVANGLAVAVGKNNTILVSSNGSDWTSRPVTGAGADAGDDWHGVAFGNGKWIAVGDSTNILVSSDGLEWQAHWPGFSPPYLKSVLYANGLWVAVGLFGTILTSPDGVTWAIRPGLVSYDLNEVAYGNGQFVVVGDHGTTPNATILTSADGAIWFDRSFLAAGKNARGISFAHGAFVVALNDGRVLYSTEPQNVSWVPVLTGIFDDGANLRGVAWSNNLWVVVGNDGLLLTSTNAFGWRSRITPTDENLHAVKYFNNSFIVVGNSGTILQSDPITSTLLIERKGSQLHIIFSSPYEGEFHLQQTEDFNWKDLGAISNGVGTVEYNVTLPPGTGKQFYRVVP